MKSLQLALWLYIGLSATPDIYSYTVNDLTHTAMIDFRTFKGKKILIVNTALSSPYADQFSSLDSLSQRYKDNLVVIAFPSNSFGNESENEKNISRIIQQRYNVHFYLAEKVDVKGSSAHPLYQWLTQKRLNNVLDNSVNSDFVKFLIDEEGNIAAVFSASTSPMSNEVEEMITSNFKN